MNINEVICNLVNIRSGGDRLLDPMDDLARFQSTNDTLSTAIIIILYRFLVKTEKLVVSLQETLVSLESEYADLIITGRTELQDALPMSLGQVFGTWAGGVERDRWRLHKLTERLRTIPLGGTAIGTCFFAPRAYVFAVEKKLRNITSLPLCRSQNLPDAIAMHDSLAELSSGFSLAASTLFRISTDLLLYTSSLSGEITHPDLQYGSTIMPSKTNPVLLEFVRGLSIDIQHECAKIGSYCREGQFQLNAFLPFILDSFIKADSSLGKAYDSLNGGFFHGMVINRKRIEKNLFSSPALLNTLRSVISYKEVKELQQHIDKTEIINLAGYKKIIAENTDLTITFLDKWFEPGNLTSYIGGINND